MKKGKLKISQAFQRGLLVLVVVAFLTTTACLWAIQSRLSEKNAINLLELNISDVQEDIMDASDENLLKLTHHVAADLNAAAGNISDDTLQLLVEKYDVTEINVIDK